VAPLDNEQLIFEGWEALCREFAQPVFFEKSPQHPHHWAALSLMLQWAQKTDFRVRFVGLVRNPMAVIYSAMQLFYTDPVKRQYGWLEANQNILKLTRLLRDDQFLQLKYEDLVANPVQGFSAVCRFIGITYDDQIGRSVIDAPLFKWREDPTFDYQLDERVAAFAQSLGYPEDDLLNPTQQQSRFLRRTYRSLFLKAKRTQSRLYNKIKRIRE